MRTAYFTLAVAAALAATTANAVHLNAEPHLEADLEADLEGLFSRSWKYEHEIDTTLKEPSKEYIDSVHFRGMGVGSNLVASDSVTKTLKRPWEPKPKDDYHMWCYCLVNM